MNQNHPTSPPADRAGSGPSLGDTARQAGAEIKSAAQSTATRTREQIARTAADQKIAAASRLGGYSSSLHDSAKSFEEKDPNLAWFTHRAADRLQAVADYVRERDFSAWRADAADLARRHPAAFFGGLFVTGLVVGGLLKASVSALPGSPGSDASPNRSTRDDDRAGFAATPDEPVLAAPEI